MTLHPEALVWAFMLEADIASSQMEIEYMEAPEPTQTDFFPPAFSGNAVLRQSSGGNGDL